MSEPLAGPEGGRKVRAQLDRPLLERGAKDGGVGDGENRGQASVGCAVARRGRRE